MHDMVVKPTPHPSFLCNLCRQNIGKGDNRFRCDACDFDLCFKCSTMYYCVKLDHSSRGDTVLKVMVCFLEQPTTTLREDVISASPSLCCRRGIVVSAAIMIYAASVCDAK